MLGKERRSCFDTDIDSFFQESTKSDIDMAEFHGCIMLC